jgi:hypothetical protein
MAYREDMTDEHLAKIGELFNKITSSVDGFIPKGFNYAHNCLSLLDDVRGSLYELLPKLAQHQWTSWGPGYFNEASDAGEEIHHLAFSFATPGWRAKNCRWFRGGLKFDNGTIKWTIARYDRMTDAFKESTHSISSVSSKGVLDVDKMTRTMMEAARRWKVVQT